MISEAGEVLTRHGVFMEIFGLGVLIAGASGVGKSELALELLGRGHRLIADDAAEFTLDASGHPLGRCPPLLAGYIEVRGLGILSARRMFGEASIAAQCRLDLILRLQSGRYEDEPDRLDGRRQRREILGVEVCEITLPIRLGHNLAALTESACRDQKLRLAGYNAAEDFVARQMQAIRQQDSGQ